MNLLVTGRPGIGKTTLLERVVAALPPGTVSGFVTREERAGGRRTGFVIRTLDGRTAVLARVGREPGPRVGRYGVDLAALEAIAVPTLEPRVGVRLLVIDEIGKMECLSGRFRAAVQAALDGPLGVLATIAQAGEGFLAAVRDRPDVRLLEVTRDNRDALAARVLALLGA